MVKRLDRQTNALLTNQPTNQPTNQWTQPVIEVHCRTLNQRLSPKQVGWSRKAQKAYF